MAEQQYRKYDSHATYSIHNARLTKDADVKDGEKGPMVRITFVDTSRADADSDMWIEANVSDREADFAAFLKKGDILGIDGKLCLRRWGDNNEKFAHNLRRANLHPPIELFQQVKERGFSPGAGAAKPAAGAKKAVGKKPFTPTKKPAARAVVDLDDEDDLPGEE